MHARKNPERPQQGAYRAQHNRFSRLHFNTPPSLEKIESALSVIPADDRETWWKVGMALKSELGEGGFDLWDRWSQQTDNYRERDALDVWRSIKTGATTISTLFYIAKEHGWRPARESVPMSPDEVGRREQAREAEHQRQKAETAKGHQKAAAIASFRWSRALPCESHPYLDRKGVKAHGLQVGPWEKRHKDDVGTWGTVIIKNALLVPLYDQAGTLWNLQAIFSERHPILEQDKDFIGGGRKSGLFYVIGEPTDTVLIAEGYATAATVHEYTGHQTYVAFDCGNLMAVALIVRERHPGRRITICADNDRHTHGNPGVTKARAAALAIGGYVAVPEFPEGAPGTDFNDLHVYRLGLVGVSHA